MFISTNKKIDIQGLFALAVSFAGGVNRLLPPKKGVHNSSYRGYNPQLPIKKGIL